MPTGNFVLVEQAKNAQPMSNLDIRTRGCGIGHAASTYRGSLAQCVPIPFVVTHVEEEGVAMPSFVTNEVTRDKACLPWSRHGWHVFTTTSKRGEVQTRDAPENPRPPIALTPD